MKKPYKYSLILIGLLTLSFILNYFILKNTSEYFQHNMAGDSDNIVFLNQDGHEELVVDEDGNPVLTGPNAGSYNFCHPIEDPYCHFLKDTWPWLKWGNAANDPTSRNERWKAFLRDYRDGMKKWIGLLD